MPIFLTYPFGKVTIYDNYILAVMNEGITVSQDLNVVLETLAKEHFGSKKFTYITHRLNSYSIDPNVYFKTSKISNLVGFAVVTGKKIVMDNTDLERVFLKKPLKSFTKLEDAIKWGNDLCKQ